jgi:hypothetical protein
MKDMALLPVLHMHNQQTMIRLGLQEGMPDGAVGNLGFSCTKINEGGRQQHQCCGKASRKRNISNDFDIMRRPVVMESRHIHSTSKLILYHTLQATEMTRVSSPLRGHHHLIEEFGHTICFEKDTEGRMESQYLVEIYRGEGIV